MTRSSRAVATASVLHGSGKMVGRGVLVAGFACVVALVAAIVTPAGAQPAACRPEALPGLSAAWARYETVARVSPGDTGRRPSAMPSTVSTEQVSAAAAYGEFTRVASAILGIDLETEEAGLAGFGTDLFRRGTAQVPCAPQAIARDRAAFRLLSAGYSATEIVDILTGRLRQGEIDRARRMLMAGYGAQRAADYLDAAAVRRGGPTSASPEPSRGTRVADVDVAAARGRAGNPPPAARSGLGLDASLQWLIRRYATHYGVDPAIVHAMVDTESRGDAAAVSSRGALGLMQLMPATARLLGVNPRDPADNLRGGIAYFAGLVRQFGDVPSALVAYNAGPTHAERVRRGEAVLYGETRRYLERIASLTGMTSYLPRTTRARGAAIVR